MAASPTPCISTTLTDATRPRPLPPSHPSCKGRGASPRRRCRGRDGALIGRPRRRMTLLEDANRSRRPGPLAEATATPHPGSAGGSAWGSAGGSAPLASRARARTADPLAGQGLKRAGGVHRRTSVRALEQPPPCAQRAQAGTLVPPAQTSSSGRLVPPAAEDGLPCPSCAHVGHLLGAPDFLKADRPHPALAGRGGRTSGLPGCPRRAALSDQARRLLSGARRRCGKAQDERPSAAGGARTLRAGARPRMWACGLRPISVRKA